MLQTARWRQELGAGVAGPGTHWGPGVRLWTHGTPNEKCEAKTHIKLGKGEYLMNKMTRKEFLGSFGSVARMSPLGALVSCIGWRAWFVSHLL